VCRNICALAYLKLKYYQRKKFVTKKNKYINLEDWVGPNLQYIQGYNIIKRFKSINEHAILSYISCAIQQLQ